MMQMWVQWATAVILFVSGFSLSNSMKSKLLPQNAKKNIAGGSSPIQFFATTVDGLEKVLGREINTLSDVTDIHIGKCGVKFRGTIRTGMEALLWLRTSIKLMELIVEGDNLESRDDLYALCASVDWAGIVDHENTMKCDSVLGQSIPRDLSHTHFNSLTIKNAIVDQFRDRSAQRPNVDTENPDLSLLLYLHRGTGTLYRVWSGEASMHKRGYRDVVHRAALRETTAAGLLLMSEWSPERQVLCDPMCGSGTIAIEAALLAANTAPGLIKYGSQPPSRTTTTTTTTTTAAAAGMPPNNGRTYPCPLTWVDGRGDLPLWKEVVDAAERVDLRPIMNREAFDGVGVGVGVGVGIGGLGVGVEGAGWRVLANDVHPEALQLAVRGAARAGVHRMVHFTCSDAADYRPPIKPGLVLTNPPWDRRLEGADEAWAKLGSFMTESVWDSQGRDATAEEQGGAQGSAQSGVECEGRARARAVRGSPSPVLWALTGNEMASAALQCPQAASRSIRAAGVDMKLLKYTHAHARDDRGRPPGP